MYSLVRIWLLLEFLSHFFSSLCHDRHPILFWIRFFFAAIYHSYNSYLYLRVWKDRPKSWEVSSVYRPDAVWSKLKFSQLFSKKLANCACKLEQARWVLPLAHQPHIAHQPQPGLGGPLSKYSVFKKPPQLAENRCVVVSKA